MQPGIKTMNNSKVIW